MKILTWNIFLIVFSSFIIFFTSCSNNTGKSDNTPKTSQPAANIALPTVGKLTPEENSNTPTPSSSPIDKKDLIALTLDNKSGSEVIVKVKNIGVNHLIVTQISNNVKRIVNPPGGKIVLFIQYQTNPLSYSRSIDLNFNALGTPPAKYVVTLRRAGNVNSEFHSIDKRSFDSQ